MPSYVADAVEHRLSRFLVYVEVEKGLPEEMMEKALEKASIGDTVGEHFERTTFGGGSLQSLDNVREASAALSDCARQPDRTPIDTPGDIEDPMTYEVLVDVLEAHDVTYNVEAESLEAAEAQMRRGVSTLKRFERIRGVVDRTVRSETPKAVGKLIDIDASDPVDVAELPAPGRM